MAKFHLNEKGEPGKCQAKWTCPFGDDTAHYDSAAEARAGYEHSRTSFPASAKKGYSWPTAATTRTFESHRTPGAKIMAQMSAVKMDSYHPGTIQAWLDVPGQGAVAYVQLHIHSENRHPDVGEHLMMCDVETRPDVRRQGFALELRQAMEKETGLSIYSSGNMTPEGWDAFGSHVKTLPSGYSGTKPGVAYRAMGFVASWKGRVPRNSSNDIEYTDEQHDARYQLAVDGVFKKMEDKEILWAEE